MMDRPEDIPEDVWDATDKPAFRVALDVIAGQQWDIRPTIARAILAEREAAANFIETMAVARSYAGGMVRGDDFVRRTNPSGTATLTAMAIRDGLHAIRNGGA